MVWRNINVILNAHAEVARSSLFDKDEGRSFYGYNAGFFTWWDNHACQRGKMCAVEISVDTSTDLSHSSGVYYSLTDSPIGWRKLGGEFEADFWSIPKPYKVSVGQMLQTIF